MCLINFAYKYHEKYPLILIGNRDEFYARPTEKLHWWNDIPQILAGRDLKDGGTWMGISADGKFATLTNYREVANIKINAPSRGELVKKYLAGEIGINTFHQYLQSDGYKYNGFNLIYGTLDDLFYYANKDNRTEKLRPGVYTLSNAFLDTPWPKTEKSKKHFQELISGDNWDADSLMQILQDKQTAPEDLLPTTGVTAELEKKLSAMFIETENYGTRLTSFIRADSNNNVIYIEQGYVPVHRSEYQFTIK